MVPITHTPPPTTHVSCLPRGMEGAQEETPGWGGEDQFLLTVGSDDCIGSGGHELPYLQSWLRVVLRRRAELGAANGEKQGQEDMMGMG